jgi:hypothetical protein
MYYSMLTPLVLAFALSLPVSSKDQGIKPDNAKAEAIKKDLKRLVLQR